MSTLKKFYEERGLGRVMEIHPRLGMISEEAERLHAGQQWEAVLEMGRDRAAAMLLDDLFVEAECPRALEKHPRLPLMPVPLLWQMMQGGEEGMVMDWAKERHQEIELEEKDPYNYGWRGDPKGTRELGEGWKRTVDAIATIKRGDPLSVPKVLLMGGNRSAKSTFAGWYAVDQMAKRPNVNVGVLCPSQAQAREVLMERMFRFLPPEWKPEDTGKANTGYKGRISYNLKTGFTDDKFSLPNGSKAQFFFYLDGDVKAIEGYEFDLLLADEEVPVEWLVTAAFRMTSRQGTILAMFTPISGYGPTVAWFVGNGKVIEDREAELLPLENGGCERMPLLQMGADADKRVVYFWSQDNLYPLNSYGGMKRELLTSRATRAVIKTRAYGVPTKVKDAAFPLFNVGVHALQLESVGKTVTWWHVMDPANGRNPCMQWWAADPEGRLICVREWPQQDDYVPGVGQPGAWATISTKRNKLDGDKGPAQESWGLGYPQMVEEIKRIEMELARTVEKRDEPDARIEVRMRVLDSRMGNTEFHGTTIQKEYAKLGIRFQLASGKQLNVTSSEGEATAGITLINDKLFYKTDKPLGPDNHPKLYVVYEPADDSRSVPKGCANTVFALSTWTGADGLHGACKDWVDVTHYFLREEPRYIPPPPKGGGNQGWGGY